MGILYKQDLFILFSMKTKSSVLLTAIVVVAAVSSLVISQIQYALASGGASDFSPGKQKSASGLKDASDSSPGAQVKAPTDPFRDASLTKNDI